MLIHKLNESFLNHNITQASAVIIKFQLHFHSFMSVNMMTFPSMH